jgi:uncharacterized protein (UPF0332 family)
VTPEAVRYLAKARECLIGATANLALPLPDIVAKEAYLAAYHAAEAFIFEREGRAVKTHRGVRNRFAHLARSEPRIVADFTAFLGRGYKLKEKADYGTDPADVVSLEKAQDAIETARRFVDCIDAILNDGSP